MSNPSLREQLESAFAKHGGETDQRLELNDTSVDDVIDQPSESTSVDAPSAQVTKEDQPAAQGSRERDPAGKFQKKPGEAEKQPKPDDKPVSGDKKPDGGTVPDKGTTDEAPATFSAEEKAQWGNTPPMVKNAIQRISIQSQTAILQAKQELADTKRENAARDAVLEPYNKLWMSNGVNPAQGMATALKAVHDFERDPKGTLMKLAAQYGISLAGGDENFVDPVEAKLAELDRRQKEFEQSQSQAQQQQVTQRLQGEINQFTNTKDAAGNPAYPYFERVKVQMGQLMKGMQFAPGMSQQECLKQVYDVACYATPEIRQEQQQLQSAQGQQAEYDKRVQAAKQARNGVVSPAATGSGVADGTGPKTLRETIREKYSQGVGRL